MWRLVLVIGVICAGAAGFLGGAAFERERTGAGAGPVRGSTDYTALVRFNRYSIVRAIGQSMEPALARYNFLLVRDTHTIRRGDILVSNHHGIHRVLGLPGESIALRGGHVRICAPRGGACTMLAEPWLHFQRRIHRDAGPITLIDSYGAVPDNRVCCEYIVVVPSSDVVGVAAGSLLSYGSLSPAGVIGPTRPLSPTLVFERPAAPTR